MMTGAVTGRRRQRDLLVSRHEPLPAVDDEDDKVRRCNGFAAVLDDELVERVGLRAEHPAGIDERKMVPLPLGGPGVRVAGRPGQRRDDGLAGVR